MVCGRAGGGGQVQKDPEAGTTTGRLAFAVSGTNTKTAVGDSLTSGGGTVATTYTHVYDLSASNHQPKNGPTVGPAGLWPTLLNLLQPAPNALAKRFSRTRCCDGGVTAID